jgi:hypothetical protein
MRYSYPGCTAEVERNGWAVVKPGDFGDVTFARGLADIDRAGMFPVGMAFEAGHVRFTRGRARPIFD